MKIIIGQYSPPIDDHMKFPCELLSEPYLAQLRVEITKYLNSKGYTQSAIAALLQVSQPVVSGYLKKSRNLNHLPQVLLSKSQETGTIIAKLFENQGIEATEQAIQIGCQECKIMRQAGPTCIYHRSVTDQLSSDCSACMTKTELVELQVDKQGVLLDLSNLYDKLLRLKYIDRIIPEIGMQMINSIHFPKSMSDIAAFPGRIIKRKNRAPIADTPVFGGSETTSQLLLDLRQINQDLRCITAIKTSDWLIKKLDDLNIRYKIITGLEEKINEKIDDLDTISDRFVVVGIQSLGFESISYVCATSTNSMLNILTQLLM